MALNQHEIAGYVGGSEQNNSSEDQVTGIFGLRKQLLEVMVIDTVEKVVKPYLESWIRDVVKTEMESAKEKILTSMKGNRGNVMHPSEPKSLQLRFSSKLSLPILTGVKIKGEGSSTIQLDLVDGLTGKVVTSGPEASAKVEIVVLGEDFDDDEYWTLEEFSQKIVREREGSKSLLNGNVFVNLKEGIGYVDEIAFTHSSRWMKMSRFRLGARVMDNLNGTRVREAKTECFYVKDRRSECKKKRNSPSLSDKVWRLKNIYKNSVFHKRLMGKKIETVKDFLTEFFTNPDGLQEILGTGMSAGKWEATVAHAQRCEVDKQKYKYCPLNSRQETCVVFNVVGQVMGLLSQCHFVPIEQMSETQKGDAQKLVVSAFKDWKQVEPIDETSPVHGTSYSCNAFGSLNSPRLESPKASNIETSHMLNGHDPQTALSPAGIISSNNYVGDTNNSPNVWPSSVPCLASNSPNCDLERMLRSPDEDQWFLNFINDFQYEDTAPELHACQQSAARGFLLVGAQTVSIDNKAQRKWTRVSCLLRWFSERKSVALESNHVRKKQRLC